MYKKPFKTPSYNKLYQEYDQLVKVKKYKTGKGQMYQACIKEFLSYMEKMSVTCVQDIQTDQITQYYAYLTTRGSKRGGTLADNTINHHLFAIRLFMDYLLDAQVLDSIVLVPKFLRGNTEERAILTQKEIGILYENCTSKLELAILSVAYGCGLRRTEIVNLSIKDFNFNDGYLIVIKGKNDKRREVPMSEKVIYYLKEYLTKERSSNLKSTYHTDAYFVNAIGYRMQGNTMNKIIKAIISRIENPELQDKKITLHSLRHSIATHLAENGAGIEFIKTFLGHSMIDTSQLYAIKRKRRTKIN